MLKKKAAKLTETQIAKTFEIVKGFNIPDGDGEKRFEPGKTKGRFVTKADFDADTWDALIKGGAIVPIDDPTIAGEDEDILVEVTE